MTKHFERDMQTIERQLMSLFAFVEKMIDDAVRSLCHPEIDLVAEVIDSDKRVDETEVAIEEECLKILALHQPVAVDLRRIATVLKINSDLERIADLACNIAERAHNLHQHAFFPIPDQLPVMVRQSTKMVRMALDSFVNLDVSLAADVIQLDKEVDENNRDVIQELQQLMQSDTSLVIPALHCFSAARHVERIADHAENIAEDVIYMVDGRIIRHKHGEFIDVKVSER